MDPQVSRLSPEGTISPLHLAVKCIRPYEDFNTEIFDILREATGEDIPDDMKLDLLLSALYQEEGGDKDKAKAKFCEVLASLSPELVSFKIIAPLWLIVHTSLTSPIFPEFGGDVRCSILYISRLETVNSYSLNINQSLGMYQELHPFRAIVLC